MFQKGAPLRLSIPPTDDGTLRHLLGPLLTDEREEALRTQGKLELPYTTDGGESFAGHAQASSRVQAWGSRRSFRRGAGKRWPRRPRARSAAAGTRLVAGRDRAGRPRRWRPA